MTESRGINQPVVLDAPARKHRWNDPVTILPGDSPNGCELHERTCCHCRMVRITNIPPAGFAWLTWRTRDGGHWQGEATPPCLDRVAE